MNPHDKKNNRGLITEIVILIIALLILSYYGFNLRQTIDSPTTQDNFSYVWVNVTYVWDNYLETPADEIWNIFINDIWRPSITDIENIDAQRTPNAESNIPNQYPPAPNVQ